MHTYPPPKEKKSGKRELVTVIMRKETDKQGVEGVVESESTWFCDTRTQDIFDMTSVFMFYTPLTAVINFESRFFYCFH